MASWNPKIWWTTLTSMREKDVGRLAAVTRRPSVRTTHWYRVSDLVNARLSRCPWTFLAKLHDQNSFCGVRIATRVADEADRRRTAHRPPSDCFFEQVRIASSWSDGSPKLGVRCFHATLPTPMTRGETRYVLLAISACATVALIAGGCFLSGYVGSSRDLVLVRNSLVHEVAPNESLFAASPTDAPQTNAAELDELSRAAMDIAETAPKQGAFQIALALVRHLDHPGVPLGGAISADTLETYRTIRNGGQGYCARPTGRSETAGRDIAPTTLRSSWHWHAVPASTHASGVFRSLAIAVTVTPSLKCTRRSWNSGFLSTRSTDSTLPRLKVDRCHLCNYDGLSAGSTTTPCA